MDLLLAESDLPFLVSRNILVDKARLVMARMITKSRTITAIANGRREDLATQTVSTSGRLKPTNTHPTTNRASASNCGMR